MEKEKIELSVIYDRDIFCNNIIPFDKDISPCDFPDFTGKELVVKNKCKEEALKSIGKNIILKLGSKFGELVFKPYGTHDSLGGFLYHCRDNSINGSNGLFIDIILNGLNEIWIGIDKSTLLIESNEGAKTLIDEKISNEK
jgi:hypothetical protein